MAGEYENLMQEAWGNLPDSKLLPVGSYLLKFKNFVILMGKNEGDSNKVLVFYSPKEAMDDVDVDAIAALGEDYDISETDLVHTIWFDNKAQMKKRLSAHLGVAGITPEDGESLSELNKRAKGAEVVGYVDQVQFKTRDGEDETDNRITSFVSLDDLD